MNSHLENTDSIEKKMERLNNITPSKFEPKKKYPLFTFSSVKPFNLLQPTFKPKSKKRTAYKKTKLSPIKEENNSGKTIKNV